MESYSTLLNLNFMASLRTENIIIDMLLAALIPFLSSALYRLVYSHWPSFLHKVGSSIFASKTTCSISHDVSSSSVDLDENIVLREAVMQYVGTRVAPLYPEGSFMFKRNPGNSSAAVSKLDEAIRNNYSIQTVPAHDTQVEINKKISFNIGEEECKLEKENGEEKIIKRETVNLSSSASRFSREDATLTFVTNGLEWYKQKVRLSKSHVRYLYQPLDNSKKSGSEKALMSCQRYPLTGEKTFNTLFFDGKEKLLKLLDDFDKKRGKFSIPGFPHKLVLLLHGPPGTGKTSLVKAIAEHTRRNILAISLSRIQTNRQLISYMFDPTCSVERESYNYRNKNEKLKPENVVYMLEDIDAASKIVIRKDDGTREKPAAEGESIVPIKTSSEPSLKDLLEPEDKVSINGLLDALKGILDSPRRIIVMTTNHIEKLDPALIRPGVVTLKLHMGTFSPECALEMIHHYFGEVKKETQDQIVELIKGLREKKEKGYSPAEVEQLCAENDTVEELLHALKCGSRVDIF